MNRTVIPVVLGGGKYQEIAPEKSFINAYQNFRNDPGQLARFLKDLMEDKSLYAQYFWWKDYYTGMYY